MAMSWIPSVRERGVLRVHANPSIERGMWRAVFRQAVEEFNRLSRSHSLGVTLERADRAEDAEVRVEAASRTIDREYEGARIHQAFDGNHLHGYTALASRDGEIERALVFLPSAPLVNTPSGRREVGSGVKLLIAVHELVHACGLTNADHSSDDLFLGVPNVDPGDRPEGDKVRITYGLHMPPLALRGGTVNAIRALWG